jgi:hypothetical protein
MDLSTNLKSRAKRENKRQIHLIVLKKRNKSLFGPQVGERVLEKIPGF